MTNPLLIVNHAINFLKVKGLALSKLSEDHLLQHISEGDLPMYERIWDEADYVIPPSEANAFFVMTNVVITPNQTRGRCPENHVELPQAICKHHNGSLKDTIEDKNICIKDRVFSYKSHGPETGRCIRSDQGVKEAAYACEVSAWCPIELDVLPMANKSLIQGTDKFTVFIKNSITVPYFDAETYRRNNMPGGICLYDPEDLQTHYCPIFRLGDMMKEAGGNNCSR